MLRFVGLSLSLLLLALLGLGALLYTGTSLGPFHGLTERYLSQAIGRQLDLSEDIEIQVGSELRLRLGGASLANAPWAVEPLMASLKQAELAIDARSLWDDGPLVVNSLIVEGLHVNFERDEEGNSNLPRIESQGDDQKDVDREETDSASLILVTATSLKDIHLRRTSGPAAPELDFRIDALDQRLVSDGMSIAGNGQLQERPWTLTASGADLESHLRGENLHADFAVALDELRFAGSYRLPKLSELENLSLNATLRGPLPPRLAALSPILEAREPMLVDISIDDVDPGIRIDVRGDLLQLDFTASGEIDNPEDGDGAEIRVSMDAASLPRLAAALDLGDSDEVPLNAKAAFSREGRRISLRDIDVRAGDQSMTGSVLIPAFPGTDDAVVDLTLSGPDFSFVQGLFRRRKTLPFPYAVEAQISAGEQQRERVHMALNIGDTRATVAGSLSEYPRYLNSALDVDISGPDLGAALALAGIDFPAQAFSIEGGVTINDAGVIHLNALRANSAGLHLQANGQLNGHPEFDDLTLSADFSIPSLADSGDLFGTEGLGDVPVSAKLQGSGSIGSFTLEAAAIAAGASSLRSAGGTLSINDEGLRSDLRLEGRISQLPALLGEFGTNALAAQDYRFDLVSRIDDDVVEVRLEELTGPGILGAARVSLPADLKIDARALLEADIQVLSPDSFLPDLSPYRPPPGPLSLHAETRGGRNDRQITVALHRAENEPLLSGKLQLPDKGYDDVVLSIEGSGSDLRVFGDSDDLPDIPLPYRANVEIQRDGSMLTADLHHLEVAGTTLVGTVAYSTAEARLVASLDIPDGNLQPWVDHVTSEGEAQTEEPAPPPKNAYLIPDSPLPLETLTTLDLDVQLTTGDLGLADPGYPDDSLVEAIEATVRTDGNTQTLVIQRFLGTRGEARGSVSLAPEGEEARLQAELHAVDLPIGVISRGKSLDALPRNQIDAGFTAHGSTYRDLAASLNGNFLMVGGPGTLDNVGLSLATESFFSQLFQTLVPALTTEARDMNVQCTVLALQAEDGIVDLNPGFVFRTDRVDLSARGSVDLQKEKIAIRFDNQARKGFGFSAASLVNPYVQITGRLAKPTLGLDVKGSAIAGGAAVATGGLTVLAKPLFGRFIKRSDPCKTARDRWSAITAATQTPSPDA